MRKLKMKTKENIYRSCTLQLYNIPTNCFLLSNTQTAEFVEIILYIGFIHNLWKMKRGTLVYQANNKICK